MFRFYTYNLLYWLILSFVARLIFMLFYLKDYPGNDILNLIKTFRYGFRLDLSMGSYIVALCLIIWSVSYLFKIKFFFSLYRTIGILILALVLLITMADIAVYNH